MIDARLVVVGGNIDTQEITLNLPAEIGRGTEADIVIADTLISRRHARIFERDGALFVEDLDSLNGTFVNNRRISTAEMIQPNELLTLGTFTFRAIYELGPLALASQKAVNGAVGANESFEEGEAVRYDADAERQDTIRLSETWVVRKESANNLSINNLHRHDTEPIESPGLEFHAGPIDVIVQDGEIKHDKQLPPPPSANGSDDSAWIDRILKIPR